MRRASISVLCAGLMCGCMTFDTRTNPDYDGPPLYSGTRVAFSNFSAAFYALNLGFAGFFLADGVLSGVADTLLLPLTVPQQLAWSKARRDALDASLEQPSPIQPARNEAALVTARRLFNTCNGLVRNQRLKYTDCYAVTARIEIQEDGETRRTLSGSEYKLEVREALARMRGTTRFVRYDDPVFEEEGDRVRVRASRIDPEFDDETTIELLMGPGEDGGWRILEEKSIGWK